MCIILYLKERERFNCVIKVKNQKLAKHQQQQQQL